MSDTRRIAKNTLMLYFRQILIMAVSLYTVRIVLNVLGAKDYGIYNVVAGVVVLFTFVNNAMAQSTQRFLNYSIGEHDFEKTRITYSASILIHAGIAILFLILAETIGLWFVQNKLNVPENRQSIIFPLYQCTLLSTVFLIFRVPYNAVIIAYENMQFYAWTSILEAVLKLGIAFCLQVLKFDSLILYSFLIDVVSFLMLLVYKVYCNYRFETARFIFPKNKLLVNDLLTFSSWTLFGGTASLACNQGTNVIMNIFTNVFVNAAYGISNQVNSAVNSFISNFQTAFNPQIVKLWAENEKDRFYIFVKRTIIVSLFLQLFIVIPLCVNIDFVLTLWLKNPPAFSSLFVCLFLLDSLLNAVNGPLWMAVQASGKIRNYQIIVSVLMLLNLPFDIIFLAQSWNVAIVFIVKIIVDFVITVFRFIYVHIHMNFMWAKFIYKKLIPCALGSSLSFLLVVLIKATIKNLTASFLLSCCFSVLSTGFVFLLVGLDKNDRIRIFKYLLTLKNKYKKSEIEK